MYPYQTVYNGIVRRQEEIVGHYMRAELDPDDSYNGTATNPDVQGDLMQYLREKYHVENSYDLVKGHLLNHDLGGLAIQPNLFPLSGNANKEHSRCIEEPLKKYLYSGNKCVYTVQAVNNNLENDGECKNDFFKCSIRDENNNLLFNGTVESNIQTGEGSCDEYFRLYMVADKAFASRKKRWSHNYTGERREEMGKLVNSPLDSEIAEEETIKRRKAVIEAYYEENEKLEEDMILQLAELYGIDPMVDYLIAKCPNNSEIIFNTFMQMEFRNKCNMIEILPSEVGFRLLIESGLLNDVMSEQSAISLINGLDLQYQVQLVKVANNQEFTNIWLRNIYGQLFSGLKSLENDEISLEEYEDEVLSDISDLMAVEEIEDINPFRKILKQIMSIHQDIIMSRNAGYKIPEEYWEQQRVHQKRRSEILKQAKEAKYKLREDHYAERQKLDASFDWEAHKRGEYKVNDEYFKKQREVEQNYKIEESAIWEQCHQNLMEIRKEISGLEESLDNERARFREKKAEQLPSLNQQYYEQLNSLLWDLYVELQSIYNDSNEMENIDT